MRTEELLTQSQGLTQELQKQSEELRETNDELQEKARLLSEQNRDIEIKNEEIELARRGLEEKAAQLALSSKYKSEFLANMSHELRTPLNSMLILSPPAGRERGRVADRAPGRVRADDPLGRQRPAVADQRHPRPVEGRGRADGARPRADRAVGHLRGLRAGVPPRSPSRTGSTFSVEIDPELPPAIVSDEQRLKQILKNLLSNAFKFTHAGGVTLSIGHAADGTALRARDAAQRRARDRLHASPTPASAFPTTSSARSSRRSSRPTEPPRASTAGPASACRSRARSRGCWAARSTSTPPLGRGSSFTLFLPLTERVARGCSSDAPQRRNSASAAAGRRRADARSWSRRFADELDAARARRPAWCW